MNKTTQILQIIPLLALLLPCATIHANDSYREGKKAFSRRDYEKALMMFERALQSEPSNGNPFFYMGYIFERKEDPDQGVEYYRKAVRLQMDPDLRQKAYWKIVLHYKYREDWTNLLIYSEEFLKINQSEEIKKLKSVAEERGGGSYAEVTLTETGSRKLDEGDVEGAVKSFRTALKTNPDYEPALWKMSIVQMGRYDYDDASRFLGRLVSLRPESWEYRYKLAICKFHLNRYEDSISDYRRARDLNTEADESFRNFSSIGEALALLETGDAEQAAQRLKDALAIKESAIGYGALSRAHVMMGKVDDAASSARRALDIEVDQKDALIALAEIEYGKKEDSQARILLARLSRQIKKERLPRSQERSMLLFALLSSIEGDYNTAHTVFRMIRPEFVEDLESLRIRLPSGDEQSGDGRFIRMGDYEYYYGKTLLNKKQYGDALERIRKVKDRRDSDYLISACHAGMEDEDEALSRIKMAIESNPSSKATALKDPHFKKLIDKKGEFYRYLIDTSSEVAE